MVTFSQLGKYGRFGNSLFQIAGVMGIAEYNGYEYGFPKWINWDAFDRFNTKENINVFEYFENPLPECTVTLPDHFVHWGFWGLKHPDNRSYSGHFQSARYFDHIKDKIVEQFRMKDEYPKNDYTAIHIRMGDYDGVYHPVCGWDYYKDAMAVIPGPYLVFSDEIERAKKIFTKCEFFDSDTFDSFKMMKSCKNHIIANSSYSWWAAYLAGGEVVAPKKWFGDVAGLETKDIYCDNWTVL